MSSCELISKDFQGQQRDKALQSNVVVMTTSAHQLAGLEKNVNKKNQYILRLIVCKKPTHQLIKLWPNLYILLLNL